MKLPCYTSVRPFVHGYVVAVAECEAYNDPGCQSRLWMDGWRTKALVCLETFAKGRVVEMKWTDICVTETIEQAKASCESH